MMEFFLKNIRKLRLKFRYWYSIRKALGAQRQPILIYQMGKVASSTIANSLRAVPDLNVFHIHRMNLDHIYEVHKNIRQKRYKLPDTEYRQGQELPDAKYRGMVLYKNVIKPRHKAYIITMVRDPISRNISAYFENLDIILNIENASEKKSQQRLINKFFTEYSHTVPLDWFDVELKNVLGVDIYKYIFPVDEKYQIIHSPPYDILIIRSDLDDEDKIKVTSNFLGCNMFPLISSNAANNKPYREVYSNFINSIIFPADYVDSMLNSKFTRHFFSMNEIKVMRNKWLHKEI